MARGHSMRVYATIFVAFLALFVCTYREHHRRLLAMHDSMLLGDSLHKVRDKLHKAEVELAKANEDVSLLRSDIESRSRHHHSERENLVETTNKIEEEAEFYKTHNQILMEQLKKIERELVSMNKTEMERIAKEEAMVLDEIVVREESEEDALKIKHAQDLLMKVLKGRAIKLHGHKPIFYNATKIQGDELVGENGVEEVEEVVYRAGHEKSDALPQYWVYQNEGKTHYSHMAMISALPKLSLFNWIACWQTAHRHEGTDDQHFRCSLSLDARTWTSHLEIPLRESGCVWSPVLFLEGNVLFLFYSESVSCMRPPRQDNLGREVPQRWSPGGAIKYVKSVDGIAWTKPTAILHQTDADHGIPKVIANQPILTSSGKLVLPWWQEVSGAAEATDTCVTDGEGKAGVLISSDKGHTWEVSKTISHPFTWLIEGTLVELADTSLLQLFRTVQGSMYSSRSVDGGKTWSEAEEYALPNPNSKFNLIKLASGDLLVTYNHQSYDRRRINLRVGVSKDEGKTWHDQGSLQPDYIDQEALWQRWHYPTAIQDKQNPNRVLVVYSCDYIDPDNTSTTVGGIRIAIAEVSKFRFGGDNLIQRLKKPEYDESAPFTV
ncbi:sialidase [Chloropicon primus]|uniref:Sialidase n=2 Tax=Chloropicon primus TaxID=1764295 RepID=A0A5B8MHS5_9CHLO|nr:sialidase [Chloropicon primus]UPQ99041.1 sialidase [Chloropicon primus]|eukprot:QDZ19831.1 sialidase [Chloropicon primus]